ncbi:MAG: alpha-amylase family glycosyl hydrolase [Candidatus Hydrogenedentes bacterium]|nr:alpha-amylase family glycosyl hydrolase [Candidatus Hydrogenedentota bacterium]
MKWYPLSFVWRKYAWDVWNPMVFYANLPDAIKPEEKKKLLVQTIVDGVNKENTNNPDFLFWSYGELRALELITEVFRYVIDVYCNKVVEAPFAGYGERLEQNIGESLHYLLKEWLSYYPPIKLFYGENNIEDYFVKIPRGSSSWENTLIELLLGWVNNHNPACKKYKIMFDDEPLKEKFVEYIESVKEAEKYFSELPPLPETNLSLWDTLWEPIRACPNSLEEQLEFIRRNWSFFLPAYLLREIDVVRGVIREERIFRGFGKGPLEVLDFRRGRGSGLEEYEAYSPDRDWMPNLVLIAKLVYVWLYQLSKKYKRNIRRLDEIPDEELDQLARWGFTGLWLIGVWERSEASKTIKRLAGNPEAIASAYSIYEYEVARDLGGEEALSNLKERAWKRGIRLASDMVPNHYGIYSRWVIEYPERFIQLPYSPFPSYKFTGPNLSLHPDIGIYIEDGYWDRTDAAVVFKWQNFKTGEVRYIYHGNDGTHMPWNDTAQLNFLLPEVREAVKQTILKVSEKFPIIRFDAAMTLTKRHFQRLWYPAPDEGGAIPSRADYGMAREEFDKFFPKEFWREVVDMIAEKSPDTLLLAEAFWLLEGYFVRTLGMHRVYNSAFMNMLKMEDNAKYRQTVKNILEFSPPVLQRFVNFMNNPDEETAVAQFGKGDKYFGIATMMVTLPGLPMFGHGQIEGYAEKYGMEYSRAYWDELPDDNLIHRHEVEIFPLMRKRYLFSGAQNFAFYDFVTPQGWVDENVFAYTNRVGEEKALVIYNNSINMTRGRIFSSTRINVGPADSPYFIVKNLGEALGLKSDPNVYYVFREHRTRLDYIISGKHLCENGFYVELQGYEYKVFLDWREVHDQDGIWARVAEILGGKGISNIEDLYKEFLFSDVLEPLKTLISPLCLGRIISGDEIKESSVKEYIELFWNAVAGRVKYPFSIIPWVDRTVLELGSVGKKYKVFVEEIGDPEIVEILRDCFEGEYRVRYSILLEIWGLFSYIGGMALHKVSPEGRIDSEELSVTAQCVKEWYFPSAIEKGLLSLGYDKTWAMEDAQIFRIAIEHSERLIKLQKEPWAPNLYLLFSDPAVKKVLGVHEYGGRTWLVKEKWEFLLRAMFMFLWFVKYPWDEVDIEELLYVKANIDELIFAASESDYDFYYLFESIK